MLFPLLRLTMHGNLRSVDILVECTVFDLEILYVVLPYQAHFSFWLDPKSKQKGQGCVRIAPKNYTRWCAIVSRTI